MVWQSAGGVSLILPYVRFGSVFQYWVKLKSQDLSTLIEQSPRRQKGAKKYSNKSLPLFKLGTSTSHTKATKSLFS